MNGGLLNNIYCMKKNLLVLFFCFQSLFFIPATAQEYVRGIKPGDFEWKLIGRVFFDGGYFFGDSTSLGNSFQVNDIRLGTQIRFLDDWEAKIELGYGDSKVSLKDVYLGYKTGAHVFKLGHQYEPFGYSRVGTANYRFMTNAPSEKALGNKRKLGITYCYNRTWLNVMTGVFSEGEIEKSKPLDQGYSLAGKIIGRPLMGDRKLIHIGIAPKFISGSKEVNLSAGIPTDLLASDKNAFVKANVGQIINQWKLDMEIILLYHKWYFQGQYFQVYLNRFGVSNYKVGGGYAQAGYLILGEKHNYNPATGMIGNPAPKSLEVLFRYDRVDLNNVGIQGGRMSDFSLGMNYFINKYVAAKINYTYLTVGHHAPGGDDDFGLLQARVQFSF